MVRPGGALGHRGAMLPLPASVPAPRTISLVDTLLLVLQVKER